MPVPDWSPARDAMRLDATVTNLNTGSFGPLPRVVFEHVTALRRQLAEGPMNFFLRQAPPLLWQARQRLADYVHADVRRLAFAANVSAAINTIAAGIVLPTPGEILLTDHEYGAMHWCWERAARRMGLSLRTFPLPTMPRSPAEIIEAACAAFTSRTRLFFFSHILSPTGLVLPAQELCAEARRRGILTVIDGAHAVALLPLDLDGLGCDFYAGNGHKWLLAPTGAGFLHFGPDAAERLLPLHVSWGWRYDRNKADERDEWGSTPRLRAFEFEGTRDPCPWLAMPAAIDFQTGLGVERIRERIAELAAHVRRRINLPPATPETPGMHAALTAFRLPDGIDPETLRQALWQRYRIEAPVIERPDRTLIRVSTHFYNTVEEVDRLAEALPILLG